MAPITLTKEEQQTLVAVLDEYLSELRMEIRDTENWEFKEKLKVEEKVLTGLLKRMSESR